MDVRDEVSLGSNLPKCRIAETSVTFLRRVVADDPGTVKQHMGPVNDMNFKISKVMRSNEVLLFGP